MSDLSKIGGQIDAIENSLADFQTKAKLEIENTGKIATETSQALVKLGEQQLDIANRLMSIEKRGGAPGGNSDAKQSWGAQFTNSSSYKSFQLGDSPRARFDIDNNINVTTVPTQQVDRKPGIVAGPQQVLTLESLITSIPTTSNAIEYTRESSFVNNAAETSESGIKPESHFGFALVSKPVATVAHWTKISKQLASDNEALAVYINNRMEYGVNRRVEAQLAVGNGAAPNLSGLFMAGNFTPHTYTNAVLTAISATLKKFVLIRRIIADLWTTGYPADAILLNPSDWAIMELELITTPNLNIPVSIDGLGVTRLWGIPVIQSVGVAVDTVLVGAFRLAATIHNRAGVVVELSEHDGDNFTRNLVTVRAERRLALTVEVPAALVGGDLTPL